MINEGDESLMNPSSMRGEVSRSRAWEMLAVMNSSVADTKRYNSLYEATDEMNGFFFSSILVAELYKFIE